MRRRMLFLTPVFAVAYLCAAVVVALAVSLPDSDQRQCYQDDEPYDNIPCAGTGQDGAFIQNPLSFTDNGDGTVTDNNTGLIWQRDDDGNKYGWFQAAGSVCATLDLGGAPIGDWRLPSKKELMSIVDYAVPYSVPTISTTYFPNAKPSIYWSGTVYAVPPPPPVEPGYAGSSWGVNFGYGHVYGFNNAGAYYVRCVRGVESAGVAGPTRPTLVDNFNDTVTDNRTGLIWQQGEPGSLTWGVALEYCGGLDLGGSTAWRLPNAKELESLTDDTIYDPDIGYAIDTRYFPDAVAASYWSSSTYATTAGYAWNVSFGYGLVSYNAKSVAALVRCVRGGRTGFGPDPQVSIRADVPIAAENPLVDGVFVVTRTAPTTAPLTVFYTVTGTASTGTDYQPLPGTVTIPAGLTEARIVVSPINDTLGEDDETVSVLLDAAAYDVGSPAKATATIVSDDLPTVTISASLPAAAEKPLTSGQFLVTRTGPTTAALTVDYTASGSATAGVDYTALSGSVIIGPGETQAMIWVYPINDTAVENDETVIVTLSASATYGVGNPASATVTITSDDIELPAVTISANDPTATETGPTTGQFTVTRTGVTTAPLTVFFAVAGSATAGGDYTSLGTSVTIPVSEKSATITVTPIDDTVNEGDETVIVTLSGNAMYLVGSPAVATVTISDNDPPPTVQFALANSSGLESTTPATLTVSLSTASGLIVTVDYATVDVTALGGSDYTATFGTLTFKPGLTSQTITVPITSDTAVELDEIFLVTLTAPVNATLGATSRHTRTIENDDSYGSIQLSSTTYSIDERGPTVLITATRTGGSSGAVGVNYATENGTATDADFTPVSGVLNWADGDTANKTFAVPITNDELDEPNEMFFVKLFSPAGGATLGSPSRASVIIADDDSSPMVQFRLAASSGAESTMFAAITVDLSVALTQTVTVQYATTDGTALAGSDYRATSGMLTFAPGVTSQKIIVPIINNTTVEPDESFTMTLTSPVNAALGPRNTHTYTIHDEDTFGAIRLSSPVYAVKEAGSIVTITVLRTGGSSGAVGISYATASLTATAGSDYTATSGTLSWADGETGKKTFTVPIMNDALAEPNETFMVRLSALTGSALLGSPNIGTVTIIDDDPTAAFR